MEKDMAWCSICGFEGEYGAEIIDEEYVDLCGHASVHCACRDVEKCLDRQEANSIRLTVLSQSQLVGMR